MFNREDSWEFTKTTNFSKIDNPNEGWIPRSKGGLFVSIRMQHFNVKNFKGADKSRPQINGYS